MFRCLIAGVLACSPVHAQVTVSPSDLIPRIGDHSELTTELFRGPMTDLGISMAAGGPLEVDLIGGFGANPLATSTVTMDVLDPVATPHAEEYDAADYVVKSPGELLEGDVYFYYEGSGPRPVLLGAAGAELSAGFMALSSSMVHGTSAQKFLEFYPLSFGKTIGPIGIPVDVESFGFAMSGSYDMAGEVDAWGQVSVPAGTFEALRMFIHGEAVLTAEVPDEEPLTFTQVTDVWSWVAPLAIVQAITVEPPPKVGTRSQRYR